LPGDWQIIARGSSEDCQGLGTGLTGDGQRIARGLPGDWQMIDRRLAEDCQGIARGLPGKLPEIRFV